MKWPECKAVGITVLLRVAIRISPEKGLGQ